MVEGVHFRLGPGWATPAEVGRRALAGALSDLAAVGAGPGEAYVSLGLPPGFPEREALTLALGADELALEAGAAIAGGDVVASPVLFVSIAVTGWLAAGERPLTRAGAQPGDLVGVTGALGAGGAALAVMEGRAPRGPASEPALARARRPLPRLAEGRALAAAGASAAIDVSDGLVADAGMLAAASGVALTLRAEALPLADGVAAVAETIGVDPAAFAARSGEDYELCFCAPPSRREQLEEALAETGGAGLSWIGEVSAAGPARGGVEPRPGPARAGMEPRPGPASLPGARLLDGRGDVVRAEGYEHRW
jgi:thiamine-monophosphate kinase